MAYADHILHHNKNKCYIMLCFVFCVCVCVLHMSILCHDVVQFVYCNLHAQCPKVHSVTTNAQSGIAVVMMSVRLSVCPSVRDAHFAKTVQDRPMVVVCIEAEWERGIQISIGTMCDPYAHRNPKLEGSNWRS